MSMHIKMVFKVHSTTCLYKVHEKHKQSLNRILLWSEYVLRVYYSTKHCDKYNDFSFSARFSNTVELFKILFLGIFVMSSEQ